MQKFCRARLKKKKEEFDRDSCIDGVNSFRASSGHTCAFIGPDLWFFSAAPLSTPSSLFCI